MDLYCFYCHPLASICDRLDPHSSRDEQRDLQDKDDADDYSNRDYEQNENDVANVLKSQNLLQTNKINSIRSKH